MENIQFDQNGFFASSRFNLDFSGVKTLVLATDGAIKRGFIERVKKDFGISQFIIFSSIEDLPTREGLLSFIKKNQFLPDVILAVGGGSVIDFAKILSWAIVDADSLTVDNLIERSTVVKKSIPLYVIPTTLGTGSEVTPYATVWDLVHKKKLSSQSTYQVPKAFAYYWDFYKTIPESVLLYSVLDSLTQLLESLWNKNYKEDVLHYSAKGISKVLSSFALCENKRFNLNDPNLVKNLVEAAYLSGLSISITRTSICHSISYPLTANYGVPHGLACFFLLPSIFDLFAKTNSVQLSNLVSDLECSSYELSNKLWNIHRDYLIKERLMKYCSKDDIIALISDMFTPGRSDNFSIDMNPERIEQLISHVL